MPTQDEIDQQRRRLEAHRATLHHYLDQVSLLGAIHTPPGVGAGIREARAGIAQCKAALRGWGAAVDDHPDDVAASPQPAPTGAAEGVGKERERRLDDYLALLRQLAEGERARAALGAPEPPLTNGLPLDTLRLAMARAVLTWELPRDVSDEPTLRRSLVAALLLPLVTTDLLVWTLRSNWALGQLSSNQVAVLVQRQGLPYLGPDVILDRDALTLAHANLTRALADPVYADGCARLLEDLTQPDGGLPVLAAAWNEHLCSPQGSHAKIPAVIHLLAAGAVGVATGAGMLAAAIAMLNRNDERRPTGAPTTPSPAPIPNDDTWRIPVTLTEWHAELEQRNERFGQPAGYWCCVRPGTYRIGGWERDQAAANLALDGFWIARVPVTVAQYAAFITDGGYRESRWWTRSGWDWLRGQKRSQPWRWREAPFNSRPRQAVTGVRWYEATAFCAWLSAQLARSLPRDYTLRLPTEAEWEAAAAYDSTWQRRTYPWGNDAPTARTAVFDRPWDEAAPDVATCPAGAAACGAMDMAGTVWELMESEYHAYPAGSYQPRKDFTNGQIVWRGGSWYNDSSYVRCGARVRYYLGYVYNLDGFRVVLAPRLAH